ncbi:hypothetical protein [Catellatospora citrea]|uniref:Uncharacterized protein n=1 Tax=Catellatospora citrea TaxID=53366 RepID=A0A8J3P498_9ACTN|nr:hypothetical protein [Catellatospora citrea]RKE08370.1 hypothetical protein C8E86_3220 [Catellatospora citrea]GIG03154.1 hypothetical protein Cci01nite_82470 [Catellatospora citrea]
MFTIVINYPADLDSLMRWTRRLRTAWQASSAIGVLCLVGAAYAAFTGHGWTAAGVFLLSGLCGGAMEGLEFLIEQTEQRCEALLTADRP